MLNYDTPPVPLEADPDALEIVDADGDTILVRRSSSVRAEVFIEISETRESEHFAAVMLTKRETLTLAHALLGLVK